MPRRSLALQPGHRFHRDQAMGLLWPELDPAAAQNNLHGAVHAARRVLGADGIALTDGVLALDAGVGIDVDEFEHAATRAQHPRRRRPGGGARRVRRRATPPRSLGSVSV